MELTLTIYRSSQRKAVTFSSNTVIIFLMRTFSMGKARLPPDPLPPFAAHRIVAERHGENVNLTITARNAFNYFIAFRRSSYPIKYRVTGCVHKLLPIE